MKKTKTTNVKGANTSISDSSKDKEAFEEKPVQQTKSSLLKKKLSWFNKKRVLITLGVLAVVLILFGISGILAKKYIWPTEEQKPYCYIRLAHLVCMDVNTLEKTRYDLPRINNEEVTNLIPSPDQKHYLITTKLYGQKSDENKIKTYITDDNFKNAIDISKVDGKDKTDFYSGSWSNDSKSLYIAVIKPSEEQYPFNEIKYSYAYKYSIETHTYKELSEISGYGWEYGILTPSINQMPNNSLLYSTKSYIFTTKDEGVTNEILDESNASNLINKDATKANYDRASNNLFVSYNINYDNKDAFKITQLNLASKKRKTFNIKYKDFKNKSGYYTPDVVMFGKDKLLISDLWKAKLFDAKNGQPIKEIRGSGVDVGFMSTNKLKKSQSQKDQITDRLINFQNMPEDLKPMAMNLAKQKLAECKTKYPEISQDELAFQIYGPFKPGNNVIIITGPTYIVGPERACTGYESTPKPFARLIFAKNNGKWISLKTKYNLPYCQDYDKYSMPKEYVPDCVKNLDDKNTDRLIGLSKLPQQIQDFAVKEFEKKDAECNDYNLKLTIGIIKINEVRFGFGESIDDCGNDYYIFRKNSDGWGQIRRQSPMNGLLDCADLDKYKVSAKEYPTCNDYTDKKAMQEGKSAPNKNP